jgi:hypothetical protein
MGPSGRFRIGKPTDAGDRGWQPSADCVEEVGFEVMVAARIGGRGSAGDRRGTSRRRGRHRLRDQPSELAEVLGGGGEVELVAGTVRSS